MARGTAVKAYLQQLIDDMDAGRSPNRDRAARWVRALAIPAALGFGMGLASCDGPGPREVDKEDVIGAITDGTVDDLCDTIDAEPGCDPCDELGWYDDGVCDEFCDRVDPDCDVTLYSAVFEDDCSNGVDDDGDGLVDCCDDECAGDDECTYACPEYGVPMPEADCDDCIDNDCDGDIDMDDADCGGGGFEVDCADGIDDDGDTLIDCCDDDCLGADECLWACPDYAAPMPESLCDDCMDNDCDGDVDGADLDCTSTLYGVLTEENCSDGFDDEPDGLTDCCDPDCEDDMACSPACPEYGGPFEEVTCGDCIDDDCDGLADEVDPDCTATPDYAAPFEENCADGVDDDGDGLIDCCDDECLGSEDCIPYCPRYAAPLTETDCGDCIDDDCDGLTDGDDSDCMGTLYSAPF